MMTENLHQHICFRVCIFSVCLPACKDSLWVLQLSPTVQETCIRLNGDSELTLGVSVSLYAVYGCTQPRSPQLEQTESKTAIYRFFEEKKSKNQFTLYYYTSIYFSSQSIIQQV